MRLIAFIKNFFKKKEESKVLPVLDFGIVNPTVKEEEKIESKDLSEEEIKQKEEIVVTRLAEIKKEKLHVTPVTKTTHKVAKKLKAKTKKKTKKRK